MSKSIEILVPSGSVNYVEGSGGVTNINVHFYFANVVYIIITFSDLTKIYFYQIPCIYSVTP